MCHKMKSVNYTAVKNLLQLGVQTVTSQILGKNDEEIRKNVQIADIPKYTEDKKSKEQQNRLEFEAYQFFQK